MYNVQSPIYRYLSLIEILNKMSEKWCQFLSLKSWIANRNLDRNKKDKLKPFVGIRYEQKTTKAINTIFCSCSYFFFFFSLSIHSNADDIFLSSFTWNSSAFILSFGEMANGVICKWKLFTWKPFLR